MASQSSQSLSLEHACTQLPSWQIYPGGQSSSAQHSLGQGSVVVVVGAGVVVVVVGAAVVVVGPPQSAEQTLSQHSSPPEQSASVLQSEHWQSVDGSQVWSPGQLSASQVSSQSWQPT